MNGRVISGITGLFLFAVCIPFCGNERCMAILIASLIHEAGHIAAAVLSRTPIRFAGMGMAGLSLRFDFSASSPLREAAVCLAGPAVGAMVTVVSYFIGRGTYLAGACAALSLFNLIPASYLDGGAALAALLSLCLSPDTVWKITHTVSLICTVFIFIASSVLVICTDADISAALVSVYLVIRSTES